MIIGVLGKKFNGKDTTADYIIKQYAFQKTAFAAPIKDMCKLLFDFNDRQLYGDLKEELDPNWGVSPRVVMQFVGTELFRKQMSKIMPDIKENFWVNCTKTKYLNMLKNNPDTRLVIADVRFQNEVDVIHELGGKIIKIERNIDSQDTHESEKNIDLITNFNFLIKNNGSLEDLYKEIDKIMKCV